MKSLINIISPFNRRKDIRYITRKSVTTWKWDINKNLIRISNFWLSKSGLKKSAKFTFEEWISRIYPADREMIEENLSEFLNTSIIDGVDFEFRTQNEKGDFKWYFLSGQVTKYKNSRPAIIKGITFDISEQKSVEYELSAKNSEIEALYEESEAQNEEMASIMDELQKNQIDLEAANARLKISETKFRKIFENSPIGIIQSSLSGDILNVNPAFCKMFGYDSLEDINNNITSTKGLYRDGQSRKYLIEKLSKSDYVNVPDMRGSRKDGSIIYENLYMMSMTDEFSGEKYLTTFIEDITRLRSSQFERDMLFNYSGDLLSISDFNNSFKQVNTAWITQLGWDIDDLENVRLIDLVHPDDRDKSVAFWERLKNTGKPMIVTNRFRTKDGEYRIIRWNCIAFTDIKLIFSSGRDETERIEAEQELKKLWDRLDLALKAGVIGLWEYDVPNDTLIINPNMKDLLNMNTNRLENVLRNWHHMVHRDDYNSSITAMLDLITKKTDTYATEYRSLLPDRNFKWFFSRGKGVEFDEDGRPVRIAGSLLDITEQKEAEQRRINLEMKMQQAQKLESLGVLAGGIAHDFNNLLTSILGNSDLLTHELPESLDAQQKLIEIKRAAKLASQLTNQMLAYSGKGTFIIENIDINDLIIDMNSLLEASISKKVELSYSFLTEIPLIKGDQTQLRQVLMNLVLNGSDSIENSGTIDVTTSVASLTSDEIDELVINGGVVPGDFVFLEIKDSGCGIKKDKIKQIFEPFYTTKFTGRGLGLAAVSGIIRSHKAGLLVKSDEEAGTLFRIYFPVTTATKTHEPEKDLKKEFKPGKDFTILIAEDEKYIRDLTRKMLDISGYKVCTARNGLEAIEVFKSNREKISCILLDMTMPELDGKEALIELRKINSDIPVIITSGYCENDVACRFEDETVTGFLQKPYSLEDLISIIEKSLR